MQDGCLDASSLFHCTCPIPLGGGPARSPPMVYQLDCWIACRGRIHRPQWATALKRGAVIPKPTSGIGGAGVNAQGTAWFNARQASALGSSPFAGINSARWFASRQLFGVSRYNANSNRLAMSAGRLYEGRANQAGRAISSIVPAQTLSAIRARMSRLAIDRKSCANCAD